MLGKTIVSEDQLEAMESTKKPTKKSDFASRTFKNTKEYVQGFMQHEEFVDIVKEITTDSMLEHVRLFVVMEEFQ